MNRRISTHQKRDCSQTRFRAPVLLSLVLTMVPLIQSQTKKPSDVFFGSDPSGNGHEFGLDLLPPEAIVARNVVVRGWLRDAGSGGPCIQPLPVQVNCAEHGQGISDVHYDLILDYDFIVHTYGSTAGVLNGAKLPGDPVDSQTTTMPMADQGNGTASGIGINSFWLPSGSELPLFLHTELNAWHQRGSNVRFTDRRGFIGRGPAPSGWVEKNYGTILSDESADSWWPFDPDNPDGLTATKTSAGPDYPKYQSCFTSCVQRARNSGASADCGTLCKKRFPKGFVTRSVPQSLQEGDYVEIQGTLWQDVAHGTGLCWGQIYHNHDGWLEIHPVDSLKRLSEPGPSPEKDPEGSANHGVERVAAVMLCADAKGAPGNGSYPSYAETICPEGSPRTGRSPKALTPHVLELIDGRFSTPQSIGHGASVNSANRDCIDIQAWLTGVPLARFKASYVIWWTPGRPPDLAQLSAVASIVGQSPLTVAVSVTDAATKRPVSGMQVWVQDGFGRTQSSATTSADGAVRLTFTACPQSFVGPHLLPPVVPSPACPIYGTLAGYTMLNLFTPALAATASVTTANALSVKVSDPLTKSNAAGAAVSILDNQGHMLVSSTTAADGAASLSLKACSQGFLSTCNGTVTVSKAGYLSCSFPVPSAGQEGSCQYSPYAGGTPLSSANTPHTGQLGGGPISNTGTILQQIQLPALSASACPTADGKSCISITARPPNSPLMDIVTVTSGGRSVAGVTVSVSGQQSTAVTNASGIAVITHRPCYPPGSPMPCPAIASKDGFQSLSFGLP